MNYKKVLILGFAKSGYEVAKVLIKKGSEVIINDSKKKEELNNDKIKELEDLGVSFILESHPDNLLDSTFSCLIKNPGVPIDHKYVLQANELNIPVINEVEVAYSLIPKNKNIKIIGISGTNGKTTTTTLIYEMLKSFNNNCFLAGNIGYPLCSILEDLKENSIVVMEVSSQQLENLTTFNPNIAILTNISEAHLEFFKTFDHYKYIKSKLLVNQSAKDTCILNKNDLILNEFSKNVKSKIKWFSSTEKADCYLKDNIIYYNEEKIISIKDIILRGNHNYENIMAAIMAVKEFNCPNEVITKILKTFKGVEHRLEFVANKNNVLYYNDTEATNIKCTQIALSSFSEPTILILGGYERGQDFNELVSYMGNVKNIIGIGQCHQRVLEFGKKNNIETFTYETLKEGFKKSVALAKSGDVVLLSPASASWDQYEKCEDRGAEFKSYVNDLN